jgi:hypothetical protein
LISRVSGLLIRFVVADRAAYRGASQTVMPSGVTNHATDDSAFETSRRHGRRASSQSENQRRTEEHNRLHGKPP